MCVRFKMLEKRAVLFNAALNFVAKKGGRRFIDQTSVVCERKRRVFVHEMGQTLCVFECVFKQSARHRLVAGYSPTVC
jgi:hypothetical protein